MDVLVERCAGLDVHRDNVVATVRTPGTGRRLREQPPDHRGLMRVVAGSRSAQWRRIGAQYVLVGESGAALRGIAVRSAYINETGGTRYCVTGHGHEPSTHRSLAAAKVAAAASLAGITDEGVSLPPRAGT